jgi:3-oxoacyl-[acyl-carrier-protein] synthase III
MTIGTAAYTLDDLPDRVRLAARNGHAGPAASAQGRTRAVLRCEAPRVRIESLGVANCGTSGMTLAQRAMDDCLTRSSYRKDNIDVLIFAGVHRDDFIAEPAIAALIAGRSKMNETGGLRTSPRKTLAFDVLNGSMGFLNACYVGAGMIRSGRVKSVMVVASEIEPNAAHPDWDQLGIAVAGSAVILDSPPDGRAGFGHGVFESFTDQIGAYASWLASSFVMDQAMPRLHVTQDAGLEAIYLKCIPGTVDELLRCEGLRMDDVKVILPPQISKTFVPRLADALHAESGRFVDLAVDGRDLSSSSLAYSFLNIPGADVAPGDVGLMISVGSGLQVGAATYYF